MTPIGYGFRIMHVIVVRKKISKCHAAGGISPGAGINQSKTPRAEGPNSFNPFIFILKVSFG
jgi:hypothetical protein